MAPATVGPAAPLDTVDMQALVRRAYGHLPSARYLLLGIDDPAAARAWLGTIAGEITTAAPAEADLPGPCLNIAFTGPGLARLGLAPDAFASLPGPLQEGMVTPHRARILGDSGASAPTTWRWGGPTGKEIHLVLMVFAASAEALDSACAAQRSAFQAGGALSEVADAIDGLLPGGGREHFGFADGISQPTLKGWPHAQRSVQPPLPPEPDKWAEVNPGEIVLGYFDNFDKPSGGPTVAAATDPTRLLPVWGTGDRHHLGQNGTFLVFRQLAQDVEAFRRFVDALEPPVPAEGGWAPSGELAAKLVGRWPNGDPLVPAPKNPDDDKRPTNDFGYHDLDQDGLHCPAGSHIRRSNPRDSSRENPAKALASTKNHRIMRRGRPYGLTVVDPPTQAGEELAAERGLLFICLNADIERQFEFVQHTWLNNRYFAGLHGEVDPLVGTPDDAGGNFTVPAEPIRRTATGVPNFVTVKGGAYFFLPGIRALRYLAGLTG